MSLEHDLARAGVEIGMQPDRARELAAFITADLKTRGPNRRPREDEIRARLDAAIPGPWHRVGESVSAHAHPPPPEEPWDELAWDRWLDGRRDITFGDCESEAEAELIAHAPADLEYLLAEVAQLRMLLGLEYHVVKVDRGGRWALQHPISCPATDPRRLPCEIQRALATGDIRWSLVPPGRHRADLTEDRVVTVRPLE